MRFNGVIRMMTLLLAAPLAAAQATQADAAAAARDSAIAADVTAVMAERRIPGAQVAIVMADGTIWERSLGLRELASSLPMTPDTLIQVGSVTKIFTASLMADLVAERSIKWSDSLAERLSGCSPIDDGRELSLKRRGLVRGHELDSRA